MGGLGFRGLGLREMIRSSLLKVHMIRTIVFGGSIVGYPNFGKLPHEPCTKWVST